MSVFTHLTLLIIISATLHFFPEHGLTLYQVTIPRYVYRTIVQGVLLYIGYRAFFSSRASSKPRYIYLSETKKMRAQVVQEYDPSPKLELISDHPCPKVVNPNDVLVRVRASSLNPIDYRIAMGHAREALDKMRRQKGLPYGGEELPMALGRDCSGVVEGVGSSVTRFTVGEEVYLSISAADTPGTFAELVLAKDSMVARKPRSIDHAQAASIPYVCATTWSALVGHCGLERETTRGKRVLILAGTGGIGSFAIQLVKAWGGHVTTTCSTSGIALVKKLGADDVIDYTNEDLSDALARRPKFDVVFITVGGDVIEPCLSALKRGGRAASIVLPFIPIFKKYGKILGTVIVTTLSAKWKLQDLWYNRKFSFAISIPNGRALSHVSELIDQGKIQPVIQQAFDFEAVNEAIEFYKKGHARGKTVIVMPGLRK